MRPLMMIFLTAAVALPQSKAVGTEGPHRMEIRLEKREGGSWKAVDPGLVLAANDHVRFRFRANFDGFLYVTNHSTSGTSTLLFPREDTGTQNRVLANKEYLVPATAGSFRVDGPAGYDVVAWMVSPVELGKPTASPVPPAPPASMKPRCDDAILRARGECVDSNAGARGLDTEGSKDLVIIREKKASVVSSPSPLKGPVTYEFRLAHN